MLPTNGCHTVNHSEAGSRLADLLAAKPTIAPESAYETDPRSSVRSTCGSGFFRSNPADVLDLAQTGRTIEVCLDFADGAAPIAVVMPWRDYAELIAMRDKIASITGSMQRAG